MDFLRSLQGAAAMPWHKTQKIETYCLDMNSNFLENCSFGDVVHLSATVTNNNKIEFFSQLELSAERQRELEELGWALSWAEICCEATEWLWLKKRGSDTQHCHITWENTVLSHSESPDQFYFFQPELGSDILTSKTPSWQIFGAVWFLIMPQPNRIRLQCDNIRRSYFGAHEGDGDIKAASLKTSLSEGPQAQTRVCELFSAPVNDKDRCIN